MYNSSRIFSLPVEVQMKLDNFVQRAESNGLRVLVCPPAIQDSSGLPSLSHDDFVRLYAALGVALPVPHIMEASLAKLFPSNAHEAAEIKPTREDFVRQLNRVGGERAAAAAKLLQAIDRANRQRRGRPLRNGTVTVSSAVAVLLMLGMEVLEERAAREEANRSKDGDVSRSEKKRTKPAARKAAAA